MYRLYSNVLTDSRKFETESAVMDYITSLDIFMYDTSTEKLPVRIMNTLGYLYIIIDYTKIKDVITYIKTVKITKVNYPKRTHRIFNRILRDIRVANIEEILHV